MESSEIQKKKIKVIYLRVSDEESERKDQLPVILKQFNLSKDSCLVLEETISAYKEEVQKNRLAFLKLKELIESDMVSDIYVYSTERIERNMIRFFEFFFYCEAKGCKIHSVLQPILDYEFDDSLMSKYARYNQVLLLGFLAQNESWLISERTKKSFETKKGVGVSKKGNIWGDKLRDLDGNKVDISVEQKIEVFQRIKYLLKLGKTGTEIIEDIAKKYRLGISKMLVSRVRNKDE